MTSEDIKNVTFEKGKRGYIPEDVDDFLVQVARQMEDSERQLAAAQAAQAEAENKVYILADKMEEYRDLEETLKTALINAQRMGETVVHEAKQKADNMIREATNHSEMLHQQAEQDIVKEQLTLEKLQTEVTRFKATILNLYKQHIESLSELDAPVERAEEILVDEDYQSISSTREEEPEVVEEVDVTMSETLFPEDGQVPYEEAAPAEGEYAQPAEGQPYQGEEYQQQPYAEPQPYAGEQQQYVDPQYQQPQQYQHPYQQPYPEQQAQGYDQTQQPLPEGQPYAEPMYQQPQQPYAEPAADQQQYPQQPYPQTPQQ